jgi:hypothetical protein
VAPPSNEVPDTTVAEVPEEVNAEASVVCCERDEYLRVVIYLPIGCSGCGLDMLLVVLMFPQRGAVCKGLAIDVMHSVKNHMVSCYLFHLPVG